MKLYPIEAGNFKLDGGAMFGVVPKTLWERTNPADEKNRIEMATRSLLIEDGERLILIDTGMGNKQDDSFFQHYGLWGDFNLENSLKKVDATKHWKTVMKNYNKVPFVQKVNPDLTAYVTEKALYGLFLMIEDQEKMIREDPYERTSDLLKKVFK